MKIHKKVYTISIVAIVIMIVITGSVIYMISNQGTVSNTLNLGNEYLSELDYDSAIREYSRVIEIDPLNEAALEGLALSYVGKKDVDMTTALLEGELKNTGNKEVLTAYALLLEENEEYQKAAEVISSIIDLEDANEDYEWLDEVIEKSMDTRHDYAEDKLTAISIQKGAVHTRGNNVLGALGTSVGLGVDADMIDFVSADFPQKAKRVYSLGTGTAVVDENNILWITGSNRSGQQGNGKTELIAKEGWQEVNAIKNVAKVAGKLGAIFVLTMEGELYVSGTNMGDAAIWTNQWIPVMGYGKIMDIQCNQKQAAFLTVDGKLYSDYKSSWGYQSGQWAYEAGNVAGYAVADDGNNYSSDIAYYTTEGEVYTCYGMVAMPESWITYDEKGTHCIPPFEINGIAQVGKSLFLLSEEEIVYMVSNGSVQQLSIEGEIESIYSSGTKCVIQFKNSDYQLVDQSGKIVTM